MLRSKYWRTLIQRKLALIEQRAPELGNDIWGIRHFVRITPFSLLDGVMRLLLFICREIGWSCTRTEPPADVHILIVGSFNNQRVSDLGFAKVAGRVNVGIHSWHSMYRLSLLRSYLAGLPHILLLPAYLCAARRRDLRTGIMLRLDHFVLCCAGTRAIERQLMRWRPRSITILNNTSVYCTLIAEAAKKLKITTIFVPHAAIGRHQKPLLTDYALLEGELQKQQFPPSQAIVQIVGSSRLRLIRAEKRSRIDDGILICSNDLLSNQCIATLCRRVRARYPSSLLGLRPHPADVRRFVFHKNLCREFGLEFSDPTQPVSAYSDRFSRILVNESGVVADAAMCGMIPFVFGYTLMYDFFRFIECGIARSVDLDHLDLDPNCFNPEPNLYLLDASILTGEDPADKLAEFYRNLPPDGAGSKAAVRHRSCASPGLRPSRIS